MVEVVRGALADLLLVTGDPLARIEDAAAVRAVVRNGEFFTVEDLLKPFASGASAPRTTSTIPTDTKACSRYWWHGSDYVESSRGACCATHFFSA